MNRHLNHESDKKKKVVHWRMQASYGVGIPGNLAVQELKILMLRK